MRRKFLSVVLCVCMMLTMAPFAFAAGDSTTELNISSGSASGGGSVTPVAQVGDMTYGTLRDAVAAVQDGGTVKLLRDAIGAGIGTYRIAGTDNQGNAKITSKSFTIDFDGHTYSVNTPAVGSTGYETQGFHFEWSGSADSIPNITLKNGTLDVASEHDSNMKLLIQNYCNLTLDSMVVDGSNLENGWGTYTYITSNCCGTTWIKDTKIFGGDAQKNVAFDVDGCRSAYANTPVEITVEGNSEILGRIEVNDSDNKSENTLTVKGGSFTDVATAVKYAENNATIKVAQDTTSDVVVPADKTITLDLNGHKIVNSSAPQNNTVADNLRKHTITNNGTLTIMDSVGTGVVDNVSHGRAALYNTGTISEIKGGKFTRSVDNSTDASSANGNSWYVVYNAENATITKISAGDFLAIGKFSSLFSNCGTIGEISGGTFNQDGFIAFKNEGIITKISGGTFSSRDESCIQNWGTIDEICGGAITAGSIGIWNFSSDKYTSAGKVTNISGGEIKGTTAAIRLNDYDATYLDPATPSSTNKASATISGGKINGVLQVNTNTTLTITGGLFTTDPTAYCGTKDGKQLTGIPSTDSNYPFTVGTLAAANVDVAPAAPKADANTTKITDDNIKQAMTSAAASAADTSATGLDAIGGSEATKVTPEEVTQATTQLSNSGVTTTSQTVTLYVQPYLDITVTGAEVASGATEGSTTTTSLSLNITPMVKKVASTAENANAIVTSGDSKNAVEIGTPMKVTNVNTPVTIKLALPTGFAQDGDKLSIKHTKENGSVEYYTGTVSTEGEEGSAKTYVTFTTNGFSPFVIYAASANVASIGNNVYPSFQAAVDAAQNNDEITLLKGDAVSATMTGSSKTIKVKAGSGVTTPINVTVNGESKTLDNGTAEVTFTYTRPSSGGPGSSGGSISAPTTYAVNVNAATNGAVAADKKTASKGTMVTVTTSPSKGYVVDAVKVVDKDGKDVAVTEKDGKYVFTMPASAVTVTGSFKAETPAPVALPFTDVKSGNWFYDAVKYAYAQGLMTGTSATTFAPNGTMNRAMIVTVLYRLEKSPAVTGASKFTDVPAGQWYSDAVAWAAANKIVNGYDETTFGPMNAVTREQMAAILFRYEQVKGLENVTLEENLNRFPDQNKISAYAIPALQWAVGQKIINGNADGTLDPTGTATRAQVAQIFTNLLNK